MGSLRCFFGQHEPEGWASEHGVFGAGRCVRCFKPVGGIRIEGSPVVRYAAPDAEKVALRVPRKPRLWWLRAVYERKSS